MFFKSSVGKECLVCVTAAFEEAFAHMFAYTEGAANLKMVHITLLTIKCQKIRRFIVTFMKFVIANG